MKLHPSENELFDAYESLKRIQDDSSAKTKQARRSVEARKGRKIDRPAMTKVTAKNSETISSAKSSIVMSGGWSLDLFKNVKTTDDISVTNLSNRKGTLYE